MGYGWQERTSGEELPELRVEGYLGKLNPAVKTAISCGAIARQGSACLLLTLRSCSPSRAQVAGIQWPGHSAGSYFWRGADLLGIQRREIDGLIPPF